MSQINSTLSEEIILKLGVTAFLSSIGVTLNIAELVLLYRIRKYATSNEVYLASLSVADLVYVLIKPLNFAFYQQNILVRESAAMATMTAVINVVFHLLVMTTDRYIAVHKPFWHKLKINKKHALKVCIAAWTITILIATTCITLDWYYDFQLRRIFGYIKSSLILFSGVCYLTCYSYIIVYVVKKRNNITQTRQSSQRKVSTASITSWYQALNQSEIRTIRMSAAISISFILLQYPSAIADLIQSPYSTWFHMIGLLNCSVDSLIYFFWGSKARLRSQSLQPNASKKS